MKRLGLISTCFELLFFMQSGDGLAFLDILVPACLGNESSD